MAILLIIIVFVVVLATHIKIVPKSYRYVIEKRGNYKTTWDPGFHFRMPFETIRKSVPMHEMSITLQPSQVITKDNIVITADAFMFYSIYDPRLYAYGIGDISATLNALSTALLRDKIGQMEREQCLRDRNTISKEMTKALDQAVDKWGIKVNKFEIKTLMPTGDIHEAVERQLKADRK
ncbi:MAG: SPFH/Band 7/PHB domain protein [Proteobacteria bacterium]|nr:SPFH/Band 7/PHB domain protein [Pseudomonadota bacterium]